MKTRTILLDHGSGGLASEELIKGLFLAHLESPILAPLEDSAVLETNAGRLAFTTDSYVVEPIFFPGGDIGSLSVNGTINDLAMRGARPLCLSLGLILEEGFGLTELERIITSVGEASRKTGVPVVTGDTKVVPRGKADGIFINTSGIGMVPKGLNISVQRARPGDLILLSGSLADHGVTILTRRARLAMEGDLVSDTAALHTLVQALVDVVGGAVHTLRDPTRGGFATSLYEIGCESGVGIEVEEALLPIRPQVRAACDLLGLDPLYLANEGKCIAIVSADAAEAALAALHTVPEGRDAAVVGKVTEGAPGRVVLHTAVGGARALTPLSGELLPRIC